MTWSVQILQKKPFLPKNKIEFRDMTDWRSRKGNTIGYLTFPPYPTLFTGSSFFSLARASDL